MKQLCIISAPPDTYSGYGSRSRDFIKALYDLKKEEWEIGILPQRWGNTSWGFLDDNIEEWGWMKSLILTQNPNRQPDVWIQITVPNEFQPVGKVNIGVTAGIETTLCDVSWIEGVNRMNVTLVSSQHAKTVFEQSSYEQRDQAGNVVSRIKLEKPVEVLFEGVDLQKYFPIEAENLPATPLVADLDSIKEAFAFLFVGHWLPGELGEDRKNVGLLIKTFLETFKGKKTKPALILKTSSATACIMDRDQVLEKINTIREQVGGKDLPNIYLLHGELDDEDINTLYNHPKVKTMISLTKGEGYGRPLAEFALTKKPIIVSAWSGQMDFLTPEFSVCIPGELKQIHPSAVVQNMLLPESGWFAPNVKAAADAMEDIVSKYDNYTTLGKRQGHRIKTQFSREAMTTLLGTYVDKYVPKQVALKLPTLKRIELPQFKKL